MLAYYNVEGYRHGLLDFHAPSKALLNLQEPVTKGLKTNFRRRRRLVGKLGLKKMRVATLSMIFNVTYYLDLHSAISFYY